MTSSIRPRYDAVVVGAGPNGLAAAITLARAGHSVVVYEASDTIGGGSRTKELTLPGFRHDVCSAIHPLGLGSPFFQMVPLERYGVEWIQPDVPLAHPVPRGPAAVLERTFDDLEKTFGHEDAAAWRRLFAPLARHADGIEEGLLAPLRPFWQMLHPLTSLEMLRMGAFAFQSARGLAERTFEGDQARALFGGMAAHSMLPLERPMSAAAGLQLGTLAHAVGWPIPMGGSQTIVNALAAYLGELGGEIVTGVEVRSLSELPPSRAVLCDVTPRQLLRIAGEALPDGYRRQLQRFRYGPGVFKLDLALDGPIPWADPNCARAGTVHVGGALDEVAAAERNVWAGVAPERPFVLLAQPSLFDPTRAPDGKRTAWAYCHVPHGSDADMTGRIEAQIERFAPGFRDRILARHTFTAREMEAYNPNYVGGDINGGVQDMWQQFTRPTARPDPYSTPVKGLFICSSSTPPGGGVHGMCGYFAAQSALRAVFGRRGAGLWGSSGEDDLGAAARARAESEGEDAPHVGSARKGRMR